MTFTDPRDGKAYKTVQIGELVWLAENLAGGLYDWEAAKKACPPGWHLPSNEEWKAFAEFCFSAKFHKSGILAEKKNLVTSVMPCDEESGRWWSASEDNRFGFSNRAWYIIMDLKSKDTFCFSLLKSYLLNVRCVRDYAERQEITLPKALTEDVLYAVYGKSKRRAK